ncbi:hypothetical protein PoB_003331600 [Plakobranchus ocellatus]|uniref:Uncharacterized protein n=1 Tax=Plakobranchus ocellatus TaxID=259542 RepID=A0AAV4AJL4_9GAST|nr:hypothetical protein PoB_003331600 [Plakobranchus ocellatus]
MRRKWAHRPQVCAPAANIQRYQALLFVLALPTYGLAIHTALRLSGAGGWARTRYRRVSADFRAGSLSSVPPPPLPRGDSEENQFGLTVRSNLSTDDSETEPSSIGGKVDSDNSSRSMRHNLQYQFLWSNLTPLSDFASINPYLKVKLPHPTMSSG